MSEDASLGQALPSSLISLLGNASLAALRVGRCVCVCLLSPSIPLVTQWDLPYLAQPQ